MKDREFPSLLLKTVISWTYSEAISILSLYFLSLYASLLLYFTFYVFTVFGAEVIVCLNYESPFEPVFYDDFFGIALCYLETRTSGKFLSVSALSYIVSC